MVDTNFTLFETLDNADGYYINTIPWVGCILENELVLYCDNKDQKIRVVNNIAEVVRNEDKLIKYVATEKLSKTFSDLIDHIWNADTNEGVYIFNSPVTTITSGAFLQCDKLLSITIPDTVTSIESGAFNRCSLLSAFIIPNKVENIGNNAFLECYSLTSIKIPDKVLTIGNAAFALCSNLTTVTLNSDYITNKTYSSNTDNISTIFGSQAVNYTIGGSVKTIGENAFYMAPITSVTIEDSVEKIGNRAFYACNQLSSLSLGSGLKIIDEAAFRLCSSLLTLTIPDSVTTIGNHAFRQCNNLQTVNFGTGLLIILKSAFSGCIGLTSISLPVSLTNIGNGAFGSCSNLSYVSYAGTMNQWLSISFGLLPFANTQVTVVHCSDGDVNL